MCPGRGEPPRVQELLLPPPICTQAWATAEALGGPLGLGLGLLTAGRWSPSAGGFRRVGLAGCLNLLSPSRYHGLWSWPPHSAQPRRHWPWPTGRPEEAVPVCGVRGWGRPWSWATGQWRPPGHRQWPVGRASASVFMPPTLIPSPQLPALLSDAPSSPQAPGGHSLDKRPRPQGPCGAHRWLQGEWVFLARGPRCECPLRPATISTLSQPCARLALS